jgi:hypothetical protein
MRAEKPAGEGRNFLLPLLSGLFLRAAAESS